MTSQIKTELWKHQFNMVSFGAGRDASLFDCHMGTGKTLATLALAVSDSRISRVLIVCSKLAANTVWQPQIEKHVHNAFIDNIVTWKGSSDMKAGNLVKAQPFVPLNGRKSFWIINYDIVWRHPMVDILARCGFDMIVVDESHRIASHNSKLSRGLHWLGKRIKVRVCLTGTPNPEGQEDFFGQMRFLDDRVFGNNYENFLQRYTVRIPIPTVPNAWKIVDYINKDEFNRKIAPYIFRLTKEDAKLSLPPVKHVPMSIELEPDSRRAYNQMKNDLYTQVQTGEMVAANALVKGLRLQQITSGHHTNEQPEKIDVVYQLLESLGKDEPIVFFAKFTRDIDAIASACSKMGIKWGEISGRVSELEQWNAGLTQALIVQIDSGAESIDLTRACYAVFYSITWSSATYIQALARLDRPGQTRPVTYYHLIAEKTIDERIYAALQQKRDTAEALMAELQSLGRNKLSTSLR